MTNRFLVWSKAANEVPCGGHSGIGLAARACSLDVRFLGIPVSNQYRKRRYAHSVLEMSPPLNLRVECDTPACDAGPFPARSLHINPGLGRASSLGDLQQLLDLVAGQRRRNKFPRH